MLRLFVKAWCPWCSAARDWLDSRGYGYELLDVERDAGAYAEMRRLSGQGKTPTLQAGERVLADFGPEELEGFLSAGGGAGR